MARTSKRTKSVESRIKAGKIYSVGIYARLSVEGNERKNESIDTQIEIAKAFLKEQKDMVLYDCYSDLGKTGTNFARNGFERMMQDVRLRKVDCIIVKDLSRFGRNHIETGNYIEKIFPFLGVRFIAVTDHFDSMASSGENETMSINLKNLVNEMYAKDIAVKVKSSKRARWEQGSYTGGIPPYGYRVEWIDGKKCLFIEKNTSGIVKKVYEQFLAGKSMREIKVWMYEQKIHRPRDYRSSGHVYWKEGDVLQEWSGGTIKAILTNPVYTGCLVQGMTCGKDYVNRKRHDVDSEDWFVKENIHEAIISEEIFIQAALKFEKNSVYSNKKGFSKTTPLDEDIFEGVLFCGDCGSKMRRTSSVKELSSGDRIRRYYYYCPASNRIDEFQCKKKYISFDTLVELVKTALHREFSLSALRPKDLIERNKQEAENQKEEWRQQLSIIDRKIESIQKNGSEQYVRYRMGELSQEKFTKAKEENTEQIAILQKRKEETAFFLRRIDVETTQKNHFLRSLMKCNEKTKLTEEVIRTLIHRIEVYPDQRIKIIFAFRGNELLNGKSGHKDICRVSGVWHGKGKNQP